MLQRFLRVGLPFLHAAGTDASVDLCGFRRLALLARCGISKDEPSLMDANPVGASLRSFQLRGQDGGLPFRDMEGANQALKVILGDAGSEMNAGEACGG